MEGIDVFIPQLNFQAGLTIAWLVWIINFSKEISIGDGSYSFLPIGHSSDVCDWTLQIIPTEIGVKDASVTMTTVNNTGIVSELRVNVSQTENFQLDLCSQERSIGKGIKGILFNSDNVYKYVKDKQGDRVYLKTLTYSDNYYIVFSDDVHYCIYGSQNDTEVSVYRKSLGKLEFEETLVLSFMGEECLDTNISAAVFINSTSPFYVYLFEVNVTVVSEQNSSHVSTRRVAGDVPSVADMQSHFVVVFPPSASSISLDLMSLLDGTLTISMDNDQQIMIIEPFISYKVNVTDTSYAVLNCTVPIQLICTLWIPSSNGYLRQNIFYALPLDSYASCHAFVAEGCNRSVCAVVLLQSADVPDLFNINGQEIASKSFLRHINDIYYVWEIANLTNGLHFLRINDKKESLIFFHWDETNGRYFAAYPFSDALCARMNVSNVTHIIHESFNGAVSTTTQEEDDFSSLKSHLDETTSPSIEYKYISHSNSFTSTSSSKDNIGNTLLTTLLKEQTSQQSHQGEISTSSSPVTNSTKSSFEQLPEATSSSPSNVSASLINVTEAETNNSDETYEEIRKPSYQSQSNESINVNVAAIVSDSKQPNYDYLYHDAPEEDALLHDYMIAVIVSLGVAIFAVIAVISTFFLLEFVSRRKQLRNTKIRPFVS